MSVPPPPSGRRSLVATIGVFDGVHRGHQSLIEAVRRETGGLTARGQPSAPVLFTFDPHPAFVLAPGRATTQLTPTEEKLPLIRHYGIEDIRVLAFDREMAGLEPEAFIDQVVDPEHRLTHLIIGHDFALGKNRSGDAARLGRIGLARGFEVTRLPALRVDGEVVSSTRIRDVLREGSLERLGTLLGRPYALEGVVVPGDGRGRTIGVPTANVRLPAAKLPPPLGVYAVRVGFPEGSPGDGVFTPPTQPGVMNFGRRPTFGGGEPVVEVHLFDDTGDLVGRRLRVELSHSIREERRFEGAAALVAQIRADIATARKLLES